MTRPAFDGSTYSEELDGVRLTSQLARVRAMMADGKWHTLKEIAYCAMGSEAGISARLRDLRKPRFGGYVVERQRIGRGLWAYRVTPPSGKQMRLL